MNVLIVYDSFFGNTERVARAMHEALVAKADVRMVRVGKAEIQDLKNVDLFIAGSPTRKFAASPAFNRFLKSIPIGGLIGVRTAAFDTRISVADIQNRFLNLMVKLFGYAAEPAARRMEKKGGVSVIAPAGFVVTGTEGPLKDGELERAAAWAEQAFSAIVK